MGLDQRSLLRATDRFPRPDAPVVRLAKFSYVCSCLTSWKTHRWGIQNETNNVQFQGLKKLLLVQYLGKDKLVKHYAETTLITHHFTCSEHFHFSHFPTIVLQLTLTWYLCLCVQRKPRHPPLVSPSFALIFLILDNRRK